MADVIGRGVIEIAADARKLKAGVEDAKRSIRTLGDSQSKESRRSALSVQDYIGRLQAQNAVLGRSVREQELFKLALRGASTEQLRAADAALRFREQQERTARIQSAVRAGMFATVTAAAAAATAFGKLTLNAVDYLDNLRDLSKSTSLSVETLSGLDLAARQSGSNLEAVATSINKLSQNIGTNGAKFAELGITARDPLEAFAELADVLNAIDDPTLRAAVAAEALGKGWAGAAPLLSEGGARIREMIEEGRRLSNATTEAAGKADNFNDELAKLKFTLQGMGTKLASELVGPMGEVAKAMAAAAEEGSILKTIFVGLGGAAAIALGKTEAQLSKARVAAIDEQLAVARKQLEAGTINPRGANQGMFSFLIPDVKLGEQALEKIRQNISALEAERDRLKGVAKELPFGAMDNEDFALGGEFRRANATASANRFLGPPKSTSGSGRAPRADNSAEQLARAQFGFDLEAIRRAGESAVSEFGRAQDLLEARRGAALIDEREFLQARLSFVDLLERAQASALQNEIALLQRQTFAGEDAARSKLANDSKIAEAQARLDRLRADSAAERAKIEIQGEGITRRNTLATQDATAAAKAYLDQLERRNLLELAGVGVGAKTRERLAAQAEIEERFVERRRQLDDELRRGDISRDVFETYLAEASRTYQREVQLYRERTLGMDLAQSNWLNGATEALANYADAARDVAKQTEESFGNALRGLEDELTNLATGKRFDLRGLFDTISADFTRNIIRQRITGPLADALKDSDILKGVGGIFGVGAPQAAQGATGAAALPAAASAAGASFTAAVASASTAFVPPITTAALTFQTTIAAAGAEFAATVSAASVSQAGTSGADSALSLLGDLALDSFQSGINYVPRTGLYMLHQGERVVPAAENRPGASGGGNTYHFAINGPTDRRSQTQIVVGIEKTLARERIRGTAG